MKSAGASPEKSPNKSPSKESQGSGIKSRLRDTASRTKGKRLGLASSEMSPAATPVKKPLFTRESESPKGHAPMKRM